MNNTVKTSAEKTYLTVADDPVLLTEWNTEKNTASPFSVRLKSKEHFWWKCSKCGSEWVSAPFYRSTRNSGCHECAKRKIGKAKSKTMALRNNLAEKHPDLAAEWDFEKNGELRPEDVSVSSNKRVWWICRTCGNGWQTSVNHRTSDKATGCPACMRTVAAKKKSLTAAYANNFAEKHPDLVAEWNSKKNGNTDVFDISESCNKKYWWRCAYCGNEWQATVNHRSSGRGCPKCSKGQTSFAEQAVFFYISKAYPDAVNRYREKYELDVFIPSIRTAIEYDGTYYHISDAVKIRDNEKDEYCIKKGIRLIRFRSPRLPDTVNAERITCEDYEIERGIVQLYEMLGNNDVPDIDLSHDTAAIMNRFRDAAIEHSFASLFPDLASEWDQEKNGTVSLYSVPPYSNKNYWWKCSVCGYSYKTCTNHRSNGGGCPVCSGKATIPGYNDFESLYPDVAREWNYEKNELLPSQFTQSSNKRVWWKCAFGHEWQAQINERTRKGQQTGCPYCSNKKVLAGYNDLKTLYPDLAAEWDVVKNGELTAEKVTPGSSKSVFWKCSVCGNRWTAVIYSRKNGCGCPVCGRHAGADKRRKAK